MKFKVINFSRKNQFSIGIEEESGKYFISVLANYSNFAEYDKYYELSTEEFNHFSNDLEAANDLAERCWEGKIEEHRLLFPKN